ncbi:MAG: hypothetical protein U0169_18445 [Polyangiaceae bacterium]
MAGSLPLATAIATAAAIVGSGCGAPARGARFEDAFAAARRAENAGRFAEARDGYDAANRVALRPRDRAYTAQSAARLAERAGDIHDATQRYESLAKSCPEPDCKVSAEFHVARLELLHGDGEAGLRAFEAFFVAHPTHGLARRALGTVAAKKDATLGLRGAIAWLESQRPALGATDLAEALEYAIARRLEADGELAKAEAAYLAIADRFPYPFGRTWDDSLYHASELAELRGDVDHAAELCERMLRERETTTIMGTYDRPKFVPAMLRLVHLYAEKKHDDVRAMATLRRFHDDFTRSPWRDDALWMEALILKARGATGDACGVAKSLAGEFPDSRFALCQSAMCGDPSPSPGTRSAETSDGGLRRERSCPDYAFDFARILRGAGQKGYVAPHEDDPSLPTEGPSPRTEPEPSASVP